MAYDASAHPLDTCDPFPSISFETLDHGGIALPDFFLDRWGVVLFYRGVWCGYCRLQLAEFQKALEQIEQRNAHVIAASTDSPEAAREMVDLNGLTFPVGYGLDAREIAKATGCFYEESDLLLQKTGFVLRPGGEIARANYSSGPTGALLPSDTIYSLDFFQKNPEHRTGVLRKPTSV